ncbi:MAG: SH3 domain-containing protein [Spirochaetaceae bacterium]|nr:SH3 domain-containing protein [Spirochaetaceae bacterium]
MKRFSMLMALVVLAAVFAAAQNLQGKIMFVSSKTAELKSSTGFFADTLGILEYGDQVTVLEENGKWVKIAAVQKPSLSGWIVSANLTTKRIISSGNRNTASANELALAGKGFSEEVENAYRKDTVISYAEIDAMEAWRIPQQELYNFLVAGHLSLGDK